MCDISTEIPLGSASYRSATPNPTPVNYKNKEVTEPASPTIKFKTDEWNGFRNTEMLLKTGSGFSAASICKNYNSSSFSSWYLPSVKELEMLISSKETINNILDNDDNLKTQGLSGSYWSSTFAQNSNFIWAFQNEIKMVIVRDNYLNVRAIRKF